MSGLSKQDEIVNAAQELFNRFGFEKTTMTDIAKHLGISKASLYYYFDDKESIIRSLAIKEQEQFVEDLDYIINNTNTTRERIVAYSNKRSELLLKRMTLSSTNAITHKSIKSIFSKILSDFWAQEMVLITHIFTLGIQANEIRNINTQEYAELYLNILRGLRRNVFHKFGNTDLIHLPPEDITAVKQQSELFTEVFYNGIKR